MPGSKASRLLLLIVLPAAACIRFQTAALNPPAAFLEKCVLCARVDVKNGTAEPSAELLRYQAGMDAAIFCFLELGDLRGRHTLLWKWYGPSGALMRRSEEIPVGEADRTFARYLAWDELRLGTGSEKGAWTASVFLDAVLLATREFEVR